MTHKSDEEGLLILWAMTVMVTEQAHSLLMVIRSLYEALDCPPSLHNRIRHMVKTLACTAPVVNELAPIRHSVHLSS